MSSAATPEALAAAGVQVAHEFGAGTYIKTTRMPAGTMLGQHAHSHDHLSVLVSGQVVLTVDGIASTLHGFQVLTLAAHKRHQVQALTDAVWLCVWATSETDVEAVEHSMIED